MRAAASRQLRRHLTRSLRFCERYSVNVRQIGTKMPTRLCIRVDYVDYVALSLLLLFVLVANKKSVSSEKTMLSGRNPTILQDPKAGGRHMVHSTSRTRREAVLDGEKAVRKLVQVVRRGQELECLE
jgi:hypothetical protein